MAICRSFDREAVCWRGGFPLQNSTRVTVPPGGNAARPPQHRRPRLLIAVDGRWCHSGRWLLMRKKHSLDLFKVFVFYFLHRYSKSPLNHHLVECVFTSFPSIKPKMVTISLGVVLEFTYLRIFQSTTWWSFTVWLRLAYSFNQFNTTNWLRFVSEELPYYTDTNVDSLESICC